MIGVRVFELKHDKDRDVRDNTTLTHVSEEVIKLAEMVTKFDALEAKLDEMEQAAAERNKTNQDKLLEEARDLDSTVSNSGDSFDDSPPRPLAKLSDYDEEDEEDEDNLVLPLPEPTAMSGNENLPTLQWQLPPTDASLSATSSESGGALQKGFKFFFGTLDPSETAEQGEQVDIAEEATNVGSEGENSTLIGASDDGSSQTSSNDIVLQAEPDKGVNSRPE